MQSTRSKESLEKERQKMQTSEALRTVLEMAHRSYSKSFGPAEHEHEALWVVEDYVDGLGRDTADVGEIERHRGLEIGPDGTVTAVK
jgi:hypothetical protein